MPDSSPPWAVPLIEVGRRTANVCFLILSDKVGADSDPASEIEVTMFPGTRFRLSGDDARDWASKLSAFVPGPPQAARGVVVRRARSKESSQ